MPVLALLFETEAWRPWLSDALGLLSEAELERVRRKVRPMDRDELALAYGLHRLVLGKTLQCDPGKVDLGRDPLGRPVVHGHGLHTSLSHTEGGIAVALSHDGFIGIDMEPTKRAAELPAIASLVMHPRELETLARLPDKPRAQALLALWVRKEALLKASGIGLAREMHSFEAPAGSLVGLPAIDGTEGAAAAVHMLEAGPHWVVAVACLPTASCHARWLFPEDSLAGLPQ